jgi:hypothetical protein
MRAPAGLPLDTVTLHPISIKIPLLLPGEYRNSAEP